MNQHTTLNTYRLGLALSGGGAKGFAHLGVFKIMEESGLKPDIIAGTSVGALMGALYADGYSAEEITLMFSGREFSEFAQLQLPKSGLFDSRRFSDFLKRHLRTKKIEDLSVPLVIVATDLDNGTSHEFRSGNIVEAVTASCSIPIIFNPVVINGTHYVDGGLFRNFPVTNIREECERVIGVNVSPLVPQKYKQTILHIAERSYHYMFRANTLKDRLLCDVLIEAEEFGMYKTFDLENVELIARIGYDAAAKAFEKVVNENKIDSLVSALRTHKKIPALTMNSVDMEKKNKMIIYQVLSRLFGNTTEHPVPNGSIEENGVGKFADFTTLALSKIRELGTTHIWYTGVIEHATQTDYTPYGIRRDHSMVVKGKAGSPYAIKDYYDVDPDLAVDVFRRMKEFEQLVARTHGSGMKVIIDFVPNHVARQYYSDARPAYVDDLGCHDDPSVLFNRDNNFYYIPGQPLSLHFGPEGEGFAYTEFPAKVTGNDCFVPHPCRNDWYETVKLNYGVDYRNGCAKCFDPCPDTWHKMYDILKFWAMKGVDGFRCDMAEMVPVEFWNWVIPKIKEEFDITFIAEVYNPDEYRNYIFNGHFDYLYDKVGLYDTLKEVMCHRQPAVTISRQWQAVDGFQEHMLNFLENHDEQRIASSFFAGNAWSGIPGMFVSALMNTNPVMLYCGQELGEPGMDREGFSGRDGRTSIFDYWSVERIRNWVNKGRFDDRLLTEDQKQLRAQYVKLMTIARSEPAITTGDFYDLMYANTGNNKFDSFSLYAFLRKFRHEVLLIVVNFSGEEKPASVIIPAEAFDAYSFGDDKPAIVRDLLTGEMNVGTLTSACPYQMVIPAYSGKILKFTYKVER